MTEQISHFGQRHKELEALEALIAYATECAKDADAHALVEALQKAREMATIEVSCHECDPRLLDLGGQLRGNLKVVA